MIIRGRRWSCSHRKVIVVVVAVAIVNYVRPTDQLRSASTSCRDTMVVLALVGSDHCPLIMGSSLHMLPYWAATGCAFVVAPRIQ